MNQERITAAYEALEAHVEPSDAVDRCCAELALDAADAVMFSDEAVSRAAEAILNNAEWCDCKRTPFDKHDVNPPCKTRLKAMRDARAVIAALRETP